ncbi:hypothetical protein [Halocola ammonii]
MKYLFLLVAIFLVAGFTFERELKVEADTFYTDQLDNIYLVKGQNIHKLSSGGTINYEFNAKRYGNITTIDVTRPLKPMLFYSDLSQIIILDNTLSVQGAPIDLFSKDVGQITAACVSVDDHFWLFNLNNFELLRTDRSFKTVVKSGNLTQVVGENVMPNFMVEVDNWLYVNDPQKGIFIFDIYGTYARTIPVKGLDFFQVISGKIYYVNNSELHVYDTKSFSEEKIDLPVKEFDDLRVNSRRLYVLDGKLLKVYKSGN